MEGDQIEALNRSREDSLQGGDGGGGGAAIATSTEGAALLGHGGPDPKITSALSKSGGAGGRRKSSVAFALCNGGEPPPGSASFPARGRKSLVPKSLLDAEADDMTSFPKVPKNLRVDVEFDDIVVTVKDPISKEKKELLCEVSGRFRAGEVVAVMGPSGAGKTTLLNTISGYAHAPLTRGSIQMIRADGQAVNRRRVSCYLPQEDQVQPLFTTREIIMQATDLKVGHRLSRKARSLLADDILETLGLDECRNTRASQLSGGQKKRLSLAAELVDNPAVIFLDEPTTGLDTSTATQCAHLLRRIARSGRAVICTVHQPCESMLKLFDQLFVMAKGRCVYRGHPSKVLPYLSELGFDCPKYHNPADFLMEVANEEHGKVVEAMADEVILRASEYPPPLPDLKDYEVNNRDIENGIKKSKKVDSMADFDYTHTPSEWQRFRILVARCLLQQHRDWVTTHIKLAAAICVAIALSLVFGQIGNDANRTISNIGLLFVVGLYISYTSEAPAVMKYPDEIPIVKKEWYNNWYHLSTYSIALLVASLPMHVMTSTLLCSIMYYLTGQIAEPMRFAQFTLIVILTSIVGESTGLQLGSLFLKKKILSLFCAAIHLAYLIVFSGFLALKPEMPEWVTWIAFVNHLRYTVDASVTAVYQNRARLNCPEDVLYCHLREPISVLKTFGLEDYQIWYSIVALLVISGVLRVMGFFTLRYNVKRVNV